MYDLRALSLNSAPVLYIRVGKGKKAGPKKPEQDITDGEENARLGEKNSKPAEKFKGKKRENGRKRR